MKRDIGFLMIDLRYLQNNFVIANFEIRTDSPKAFEMCTKNIFYITISIVSIVGQNTVECYDNHILLTMICTNVYLSQNLG